MNASLLESYEKLNMAQHTFQTELKEFYRDVLKQHTAGELSVKDVAYQLAATLQFIGALTPEQDELGTLGGELELPDGHISGDIEAREKEMLQRLKQQCEV